MKTLRTTLLAAGALCLMLLPDAALAQRLQKVWELNEGLLRPESVVYDADRNVLYVSSINGDGAVKDGNGYITKVSADGTIISREWVAGLNAPKGLALHNGKLYATDLDELVEIDVAAGRVLARYKGDGAQYLNDVTVDASGRVYASDSRGNGVYRLADGMLHPWLVDVAAPNGVYAEGDRLMLAAGDAGVENPGSARYLKSVDYTSREITPVKDRTPIGAVDAIEPDEKGGYFLSDWGGGVVLHFTPAGGHRVLETLTQGTADLDYVPETGMLFLPVMVAGQLIAYQVVW